MKSLLNIKVVPCTKMMFVLLCVMYKYHSMYLPLKCSITNVGYMQATLLQNIYKHCEYFNIDLNLICFTVSRNKGRNETTCYTETFVRSNNNLLTRDTKIHHQFVLQTEILKI
jgi:hypothetical protein